MAYAIFKYGQPEIAGILVDNRISESHVYEAEITRIPIDGADPDVSDHIVLSPDVVTIEAWISNIDAPGIPATGERAKQALADFNKMIKDRALLDIQTYHLLYEKMGLLKVEATHEDQATGAIKVTCTFQKVNQVEAQVLPIPAATVTSGTNEQQGRSEVEAASSEVNVGRKTSPDAASTLYYAAQSNGLVQ